MNDKKGSVKRYLGKIEVDMRDGRAIGAMVDGLTNAGFEVTTYPHEDKRGMFLGETMEIYEVH